MTPKCHESAGQVQFGVIEKLTSFNILVNNIQANIRNKNARSNTTQLLTSRSLPITFSIKTLNLRL